MWLVKGSPPLRVKIRSCGSFEVEWDPHPGGHLVHLWELAWVGEQTVSCLQYWVLRAGSWRVVEVDNRGLF